MLHVLSRISSLKFSVFSPAYEPYSLAFSKKVLSVIGFNFACGLLASFVSLRRVNKSGKKVIAAGLLWFLLFLRNLISLDQGQVAGSNDPKLFVPVVASDGE